jgi:outer membrane protein
MATQIVVPVGRMAWHIWTAFFFGLSWSVIGHADSQGEWYARGGGLEALYHSSAEIASPAGDIPGASAAVSNSTTAIFELGYDVTPRTFIVLMAGVPPRPRISGTDSIAVVGELGAVTYGPAVLTAGFRAPLFNRLQFYAGTGVAYAIILRNHDAAISNLDVHNHFGYALQAGFEYALNSRWAMFVDVKQLWLSVDATGALGDIPVAAKIKLNPTLLSFGGKFRLH